MTTRQDLELTAPVHLAIGYFRGHGVNRIIATPAYIKTSDDGKPRSYGSPHPFSWIRCAGYASSPSYDVSKRPEDEIWGWEVEAENIHNANASQLEALAKKLRAIDKKMAKFKEVEGPAVNFGQYVLRFGRAIGAVGVFRWTDNNVGGVLKIADTAYVVEMLRREAFPTEAERREAEGVAALNRRLRETEAADAAKAVAAAVAA